MSSTVLAVVVYSCQVLLIVSAAAAAERLLRGSMATARLAYWRAVGVLCLALPWIASTTRDLPVVSVAVDVLPVESVITNGTASQVLPAIDGVSPFLWMAWACGAGVGLLWLACGAWRIRQLRLRSVPASIGSDIDSLRAALAPRAEFRWSSDLRQPVTLGVWRPRILLPRRFDDLSDEGKRAVACHELLHVRRRDWIWTLVEAHVRVVCWFHPGIWWLVDRIQLVREQVVDELVIGHTSSRKEYMRALMMFADSARPIVLSSAFLRRRHLKSRIRELLKESRMSVPRLALTMIALTLVMAGVTAATVRALPLDLSALAQTGAASRMEIRLAETTPGVGLQQARVSGSDQPIYLHPVALATWSDVSIARIVNVGDSRFGVAVTLNSDAAARMATATAAHLNRPLAIILDGRVVAAPTVRSPIGEMAMITGITAAAAQELIEANVACHTDPAQCAAAVLPVPLYQERPQYTPAAMAAQIEGSVLLEAVVLPDGTTGSVTVVRSLDPGLDQEALAALKRWTWRPGTRGGEPARISVQVQLTFTLK
jgi:bla regulator protein blaR1